MGLSSNQSQILPYTYCQPNLGPHRSSHRQYLYFYSVVQNKLFQISCRMLLLPANVSACTLYAAATSSSEVTHRFRTREMFWANRFVISRDTSHHTGSPCNLCRTCMTSSNSPNILSGNSQQPHKTVSAIQLKFHSIKQISIQPSFDKTIQLITNYYSTYLLMSRKHNLQWFPNSHYPHCNILSQKTRQKLH